jgi:hypothetical protein
VNFNGAMRAETGAGKQARGLGKYWRKAGAKPKRTTPKGTFALPFRLPADPGRRDGYAGMEFLLRRIEVYRERAAAAKELLRRGKAARSIFADPLPADCYPDPKRRAA